MAAARQEERQGAQRSHPTGESVRYALLLLLLLLLLLWGFSS